jgi:hypothetical protein
MSEPVQEAPKTTIRIGLAGKTVEKAVEIPVGDPPPLAEGQPAVLRWAEPCLDGKFKATGRAASRTT